MLGEFTAVVGGDSMDAMSMRSQMFDHLLSDGRGCFMSDVAQQGELAFAFDHTDDGATVIFADNSVCFPVAQTPFGLNDLRSFFDTDAMGYFAPKIVFSVPFAFFLAAADTQMPPEMATVRFVLPDVLIDAFMTDGMTVVVRIDLHTPGDLFRRMLLADLVLDIGDGLGDHLEGLGGQGASFECPLVGLPWPIAPPACVSGQLPADGTAMYPEAASDVRQGVSRLSEGIDFDTIIHGELPVLSHKCSVVSVWRVSSVAAHLPFRYVLHL